MIEEEIKLNFTSYFTPSINYRQVIYMFIQLFHTLPTLKHQCLQKVH